MKLRRQNVSEDRQTTLRRHNSEPIPIDLMIEILSRLPANSIARCRCVSKLWASTLRLPYFTELYLKKSSARPKLLFACQKGDEVFFFSSDQPQNPDENSFSVAANYHTNSKVYHGRHDFCSSNSGLVCFRDTRILKGSKKAVLVPVIYNPSTRKPGVKSFFGYDPIDKQIKLLSMTCPIYRRIGGISADHQVLTLGAKKLTWRMIGCCVPHYCHGEGICINGVLYYQASVNMLSTKSMIVCFDVRSEKFSLITFEKDLISVVRDGTLIDYNGKLGSLVPSDSFTLTKRSRSIELWVRQDAKIRTWSKHICILPPLWEIVVGDAGLHIVGMIGKNEILLSPSYLSDPFYIYYFNIKKNTVVRVGVQGMKALSNRKNSPSSVICNPSTGQSLTVPKLNMKRLEVRSYFGYDPIEKQYKVLSMTSTLPKIHDMEHVRPEEHKILTLGTKKLSWRKVERCTSHHPLHNNGTGVPNVICIDGILYYPASYIVAMIVCFDLGSEKFRLIKVMEIMNSAVRGGILVKYNGKLGVLVTQEGTNFVYERTKSFKLWVLEDEEKEEWLEHTYVLSATCQNKFRGRYSLRFVGMTRTNEIVLSRNWRDQTEPFYIFYYNIERNKVVRVEIKGMEAFKRVYTFLNHVEDVKLMQMF